MVEAGISLLVIGVALLIAEAHVAGFGVLGSAGVLALVAGVVLSVAGAGAGPLLVVPAALGVTAIGAAYVWFITSKALAVRRTPLRSGSRALVGRLGEIRNGQVFVDGALWRARASVLDQDRALTSGEPVVVERVDGLTLTVRRAEEWEVGP
jgi:membrane-bound ClpP family serine protease